MWPLLFLLASAHAEISSRLDPLVDTKQGLIRGLQADDGDYSMFLGIPYGQVDLDNPFGPSQPHPVFEEVFEAFDDGAVCPQKDKYSESFIGSLDCLRLNIFVPNKSNVRNKLPVMVWIHGGAYESGSGTRNEFGARFLVRHDVILVTINYRLGPYGFMCLDIPEVPGNQGLKDQTMALRWVKENIGQFGGDVTKITIFGESAGGSSVGQHLTSNNEKLYNQAIMQSGTELAPWATRDTDTSVPLKIAKHLGLDTECIYSALDFLKKTDIKLVMAAAHELKFISGGCVEKKFDGVENLMTEHTSSVEVVQKAKNMNILIGFNSMESLIYYLRKTEDQLNTEDPFDATLPLAFDMDKLGNAEKHIRRFYLGDSSVSYKQVFSQILFDSDINFNYPSQRSIGRYLINAKNVYHYVFSYAGGRNYQKHQFNISFEGASHADELSYLFDMRYPFGDISDEDQLIVDRMTTMWTNFAKYGNPTPDVTELLPITWPPVTPESLNYLNIDTCPSVNTRPLHQRLSFWDLVYDTYRHAIKGINN
ncbi:bile salt-activated lipase-like [Leptidea sinapis]|uniref:bile salt-activated lipase-like n=1 Tax=Leptidea sinapis TaxID=189913 RepID=UPI0021C3A5DD|nr:bile salt-activated lipase-like [Leptidea sinapis]